MAAIFSSHLPPLLSTAAELCCIFTTYSKSLRSVATPLSESCWDKRFISTLQTHLPGKWDECLVPGAGHWHSIRVAILGKWNSQKTQTWICFAFMESLLFGNNTSKLISVISIKMCLYMKEGGPHPSDGDHTSKFLKFHFNKTPFHCHAGGLQ